MKNIKNVDDINDLRFTITEDMSNMFIEIITIRQMLKENKLSLWVRHQAKQLGLKVKDIVMIY